MQYPDWFNRRLTERYLRRKGVEWSGELPVMDMRKPPQFLRFGSGRIKLGSGVRIFTHLGIPKLHVGHGSVITIGDRSVINGAFQLHAESEGGITIEPHVLIAPRVIIMDSNMHPISEGETWSPRPILLKRNCWLCDDCKIMPGVEVGEHSVVGAGSKVTDSVPLRTVVDGNPARIVRQVVCRDDWVRETDPIWIGSHGRDWFQKR
ncbi:MAG: putative acetyltransferase [Candidatus Taylorbacteria bacterium]|nr:putative acetyltransferase [Candidatus Taylorbacteria bacterium]